MKPVSTITYSQIKELTEGTSVKLSQEYDYLQFRIARDNMRFTYRRLHPIVGKFSSSAERLYSRMQAVQKIEELSAIAKDRERKVKKAEEQENAKRAAREKQKQDMLNDVLGDAKLPSNVSLDMYSGNYMISAYGISKEMARRLALILILGEPTD